MKSKKLSEIYEAIENNTKEDIVQVREVIEDYIDNDYDKFLDLKAQMMETEKANEEFQYGIGLVVSVAAFLVSILAAILAADTTGTAFGGIMIVFIIMYFVLLLYLVCKSITYKRDIRHRKLRTYITVVLEEIEKNWGGERGK